MKSFRLIGRSPVPAVGYCRRDNRVYAECPLGDNWDSCSVHADCLLLELTKLDNPLETPQLTSSHGSSKPDAPEEPPIHPVLPR
jgi:hypothetical protein